jgi:predicted XRE-type DNA-binding protein
VKPRAYATAHAFKAALDQRLRNVAEPGVGIARRRQLLVFDRYLARLNRALGDNATLKGGLMLEVRLERMRTTRDIDLRVTGSPDGLLHRLQEAGRIDLGDFMTFEVRTDLRHPDIAGLGIRYEGQRFRAESRLARMLYGQAFGIDVAFGDPMLGEPEVVTGDDLLSFAGIEPATLRLYPVETHIAEKLHAYTWNSCGDGSGERKRSTRRWSRREESRMKKRTGYKVSGGNVFKDLDVPSADEAMTKAELAARIAEIIARRKLTQAAAGEILGVDQPKVSALLRGRLMGFSTDRLLKFIIRLGQDVDIVIRARRSTKGRGHLNVVEA